MTRYIRNHGNALASYGLFNHAIDFKDLIAFDGDDLHRKNSPVLFHEYFHYYLQFNSCFFLEKFLHYFAMIDQFAKNQPLVEKIPVKDNPTEQMQRLQQNMKSWAGRLGHTFSDGDCAEFSQYTIGGFSAGKTVGAPWGFSCSVPHVKLTNPKSGISKDFEIGEELLNEGAAYLLETYFSHLLELDTIANHPVLPYTFLAELIEGAGFKAFLPVLLFVDLAFQHPSPGERFVALWTKYKGDLKAFGDDAVQDIARLGEIHSQELDEPTTLAYYTQLRSIFEFYVLPSIDKHEPFQWLTSKFAYGLKRRKNKQFPDYLIPLFGAGDPLVQLKRLFAIFLPPIVLDVGTPRLKDFVLFANAKDNEGENVFTVHMNLYFRGLFQMYNYVWDGVARECCAYESCDYGAKADEICLSEPHKMASTTSICEIAKAGRMLGFGL